MAEQHSDILDGLLKDPRYITEKRRIILCKEKILHLQANGIPLTQIHAVLKENDLIDCVYNYFQKVVKEFQQPGVGASRVRKASTRNPGFAFNEPGADATDSEASLAERNKRLFGPANNKPTREKLNE